MVRCRQVLSLRPGVSGDSTWWENGVVRAVGRAAEVDQQAPSWIPRYNLPEAILTPGFVDGHTHFGMWALARQRVHLAGATTRKEALTRISAGVPEDGWLRGHGWAANGWEAMPDRWSLDTVTSGPACLDSNDVHSAWVNSAALAAAGIDRLTADPPGGSVVRDGNGEPTGLLLEHAVSLVASLIPGPDPARLLAAMRAAQSVAHSFGVTGIHDVEGPDALRAFRQLEADDQLRLRVLFHPPVAQLPLLLAHGVRSGEGTDWLRLGGVKLFLDGSLGSRTAWMLEPYEDGRDRGMPLASEAEAAGAVDLAAGGGIACVIHAIGDAAVRRALDLLSHARTVAIPHRIEHFQCAHPADVGRAAAHGIVVSMQPAHLPGDVALAESRWGKRAAGAYRFRSLLREGSVLAFGSDVPVATPDPRVGVYAAMVRPAGMSGGTDGWHGEERIDFDQAVRAYTSGNATAAGQSGHRGYLAPGADADLVAWRCDPSVLRGDGAAFRDATVALTVVRGEVVHQAR